VRLVDDRGGMAAGSEGVLIGWYAQESARMALVRFWDGGPIRVPAESIVAAGTPAGQW
jgi:hypothetical protein